MKRVLLAVLLLSGCTGTIQLGKPADITRQEVIEAFAQRDQALQSIMEKLKALEPAPKGGKK